jgi:hypothetical protein
VPARQKRTRRARAPWLKSFGRTHVLPATLRLDLSPTKENEGRGPRLRVGQEATAHTVQTHPFAARWGGGRCTYCRAAGQRAVEASRRGWSLLLVRYSSARASNESRGGRPPKAEAIRPPWLTVEAKRRDGAVRDDHGGEYLRGYSVAELLASLNTSAGNSTASSRGWDTARGSHGSLGIGLRVCPGRRAEADNARVPMSWYFPCEAQLRPAHARQRGPW